MCKEEIMKARLILITVFFLSIAGSGPLDAACVKVPKANLRTGPGTTYEVGWTVYKYMPHGEVLFRKDDQEKRLVDQDNRRR
jgi:SH3-like domain-containing protein